MEDGRTGERVPGEGLVHGRGAHRPAGAHGPRIGVLALQGDVLEHLRMLAENGATAIAVKGPDDLDGLEGIVVPGGESTTIGKLARMYGLLEPLRERLLDGLPAFGTCAGAILLSRQALLHDGRASDQPLLEVLDAVVRRNAFGRQVASFETDLEVAGVDGGPLHAVFIRAPWFEKVGADVQVLATVGTPLGDKVVVVRQGHVLASAFHPELAGDGRLHRLFVDLLATR
ncbi:MAG TPA: pyridoxal 5'-phosphate synthase glutaminase subunit PdxT [Egibacteraceae bacterium]|nr:pyridoxal 5'-phosphate synthase glutaminase subunit PdxT [Egibacteraceae bacterium]